MQYIEFYEYSLCILLLFVLSFSSVCCVCIVCLLYNHFIITQLQQDNCCITCIYDCYRDSLRDKYDVTDNLTAAAPSTYLDLSVSEISL